jgi:magnesium-transporting ATPase (P-type)
MGLEELATRFGTSINLKKPWLSTGLSSARAKEKLTSHGPNIFKKKAQIPWYYQLLESFTNIFNLVLLFASLVFFFFYLINPMDNFQNVILIFNNLGIYRGGHACYFFC